MILAAWWLPDAVLNSNGWSDVPRYMVLFVPVIQACPATRSRNLEMFDAKISRSIDLPTPTANGPCFCLTSAEQGARGTLVACSHIHLFGECRHL